MADDIQGWIVEERERLKEAIKAHRDAIKVETNLLAQLNKTSALYGQLEEEVEEEPKFLCNRGSCVNKVLKSQGYLDRHIRQSHSRARKAA